MHLSQHKLCARKTELALDMKYSFDFHHVDRWPPEVTSNAYFRGDTLTGRGCMLGDGLYSGLYSGLMLLSRKHSVPTWVTYPLFVCHALQVTLSTCVTQVCWCSRVTLHRCVTGSSSPPRAPWGACSWWRQWVATVVTWQRLVAWPAELMRPISSRRNSPWPTWRFGPADVMGVERLLHKTTNKKPMEWSATKNYTLAILETRKFCVVIRKVFGDVNPLTPKFKK